MGSLNMFRNEAEMQEWLENAIKEVEGLSELISNTEYLENYQPASVEAERVLKSFKITENSLRMLELISANEDISIDKPDLLKPDFLFYSVESEGIVIVELKNIAGPTRQVGTELSAYSCEVRSYIPYLSEGDLFHVIISMEWPTLLRHYIFHEILWNKKNIICLQPIEKDERIQLEIININSIMEAEAYFSISDLDLTGYQCCLYDDNLYTRGADRNRLDLHIEQMKTAIQIMASEGHSQRASGFALLWKDHLKESLAPYNISIMNMAPFKSVERFLNADTDLNEVQERFLELVYEFGPTGHSEALLNISNAGIPYLKKFCKPQLEGFFEWQYHKEAIGRRAELLSFHCWGIFEEVRNTLLQERYDSGHKHIRMDDPFLGLSALSLIINDNSLLIEAEHKIDPLVKSDDHKELEYWEGDPIECCQLCYTDASNMRFMIDGKLSIGGWACVCAVCFIKYEGQIGWGSGQLYEKDLLRWKLVAGGPPPDLFYDY